jgi:hypothetical protein
MSMKVTKYITPLLAGTAAAVAIAAAPTASAADHQSCNGSGSGTVCQSRGNVQITAPAPGSGAWDTGTASSWLASNVGGEGVAPLVAQVMDAKPFVSDLSRVMRRCTTSGCAAASSTESWSINLVECARLSIYLGVLAVDPLFRNRHQFLCQSG